MSRVARGSLLFGLIVAATRVNAEAAAQSAADNPLQLVPHHVTLSIADIDKETDWYGRALGFKVARRFPAADGSEVRQLAIDGYGIDLVYQKGSIRQRQVSGTMNQGWVHIVFATPLIDSVYKRLQELGTDVKAERNPQGAISRLGVHDPEGNEIEIFARAGH